MFQWLLKLLSDSLSIPVRSSLVVTVHSGNELDYPLNEFHLTADFLQFLKITFQYPEAYALKDLTRHDQRLDDVQF
jgi:hypothetical protein